ncbi:unnamed protein product [Dracunculus medinensis]|uniref:Uncharacterized protein n=1 Tax=Dracunculus medinensis TaxID=318479 RepID=A0A0N4UGT7_DRAME|nr:unnamed protein product [Dracunculus medinensis]
MMKRTSKTKKERDDVQDNQESRWASQLRLGKRRRWASQVRFGRKR